MRRLTPWGASRAARPPAEPVAPATALTAVLTAVLTVVALAGCASSDAQPSGTSPATAVASASAGPTPSAPGGSPTPSTTGTAAGCSSTTVSDAPSGPNTTGLTALVAATAQVLFDAALACDSRQLIDLATLDQTHLSFGAVTPTQAFGLPEGPEQRYAALVRVLSTRPVSDTTSGRPLSVWPAVATLADDDAAWQEVVDAGLLTATEAQQMRAAGSGYLGWRVGIDGTEGTWQFMVAGD